MPEYRRAFVPGGTFFFTLVTHDRQPSLASPEAVGLLRSAIATVQHDQPFTFDAGVVLPDHTHWLWTLPPGDADFSKRIGRIKALFTKSLDARPAAVWQPRFWEHVVRDEADRNRLLDYIHFNPVKHGHAACPHGWAHSSFHRYVREGFYDPDWCCCCDGRVARPPDFDDMAGVVGE
jgi:putative transposase